MKRRLTDAFVKKVEPRPARTMYWDTVAEGLVLQVQPTGHNSYKLYYRFGERPRWYSIASAGRLGLKEAREEAGRLNARMALDPTLDVHAEKAAVRKAGTFEELAARYVEEYAKRRNKSWKQPDALVRRYLLPVWGKRLINDIQRSDVRAVFRKITDEGSPVMANQILAAASGMFSWAIREEVIDLAANPCHGIERNPTKARERVLSDRELPMFWGAFDDAGLVRSSALKLILLTGQRPGEVRHMRRNDIEDGWWTLPGDPDGAWPGTKNGQSHRIWLPEAARAIIEELDEGGGGFILSGTRGRAIDGLDSAMKKFCSRLGIENKVTPHDLRRTHGTTVTSLGFTREQMNRIQNHKEGGIGSVYDRHGYAEENQQIQIAVATRIMALVEGQTAVTVVSIHR